MKLRYYLKKAQKNKFALGQFNFSNFEILKGIVLASKKMNAPVILGTSEKEVNYFGMEEVVSLIKIMKKEYPAVFLNLDHGKSFDEVKKAINLGYDYVHFDGSNLDFNENIKITKEVVRIAKKKDVLVEGEIDKVPTSNFSFQELTDHKKALEFFEKTKVDGLAVSIGNVHGFSFYEKIDFERLKNINKELKGKIFLVLHGSSFISSKDLKKAISLGIVKVNINTELRIEFKSSLKEAIKISSKEIAPYKYLSFVVDKIKNLIQSKIKILGSEEKA